MKPRIRVIGLFIISLELAFFIFAKPRIETFVEEYQQKTATQIEVQNWDSPLLCYKMHTGLYPSTQQGLMALIQPPEGVTGWRGPYLMTKDTPLEHWRNPYHYRFPGIHNPSSYDVWSSGPDGIDGTPDDIGNW